MAKPVRELLVPALFLVEGVFWIAVVATGGGVLLLFAALGGLASAALLVVRPSSWATRPVAGASALFALVLTLYQAYQAATLVGSALNTLGLSSGGVFGVFAVVSVYLELATLSSKGESASSGTG